MALLGLQNLGVDPNQYKITFLTISGTEINRRLALESNTIDGTALSGSVGDIYASKGYPILYNFKGTGVTMPQTMMVTTRRIAAAKPQVIEGYVKGLIEAIAYMIDPVNKENVTRIMATNLRLSTVSEADDAYQAVNNSYERLPLPTVEGMRRLHGLFLRLIPSLLMSKSTGDRRLLCCRLEARVLFRTLIKNVKE